VAAVKLQRIALERYKGYARRVELEIAPLTILVGSNNSGKTALAQAIQLLAGGFVASNREAREPLPLESGGIRHGESFADLVTGRAVHGRLSFSVTLADERGALSLSATVNNVVAPGQPSERQVSDWRLKSDHGEIHAQRQGFGGVSEYRVSGAGAPSDLRTVFWRGLIPQQRDELAPWVGSPVDALKAWAAGVRHLRCPRCLVSSPFLASEHSLGSIGSDGRDAPLVLAADDALRDSVRNWYRNTFGVRIDVVADGRYSNLVTGTPGRDDDVGIAESGRGLSHVLPVVVTALSARRAGAGVDVIEHPEAELHPAAHADIAELLMENLAGPTRPLVVETHSEMVLLRARRWVAEGRLPAGNVLVYWIHAEPGHGSVAERISIRENGEMETWPAGVFIEDYEEILAIRRAARKQELERSANRD
jgi:hypothetical protein